MQDPDLKCRHFVISWHFMAFWHVCQKANCITKSAFSRLFPSFRLFHRSRLLDFSALLYANLKYCKKRPVKNNPQWQQTWSRPELQGNDRFNVWPKSVFLAGKSGPHAKKSSPTPLWGYRLPVSDLAGWISTGWPWIGLDLLTNDLVLENFLFSPTPSYQMEGLILWLIHLEVGLEGGGTQSSHCLRRRAWSLGGGDTNLQ